jgi:hypothetical protein
MKSAIQHEYLNARMYVRFSESALLGVVSIFNVSLSLSRSFLNFLESKRQYPVIGTISNV